MANLDAFFYGKTLSLYLSFTKILTLFLDRDLSMSTSISGLPTELIYLTDGAPSSLSSYSRHHKTNSNPNFPPDNKTSYPASIHTTSGS